MGLPIVRKKLTFKLQSGLYLLKRARFGRQGAEKGNSYFDRLWRAGGGKHAHKVDRYIIAMQTYHKLDAVKG